MVGHELASSKAVSVTERYILYFINVEFIKNLLNYVDAYMWFCVPMRPEEGDRSPAAGFTGSCESPEDSDGN